MNKCKLFPYFLIFITLLSSCNNTNSKKENELNLEKDTQTQSEKISEENQEVKTLFFEQQVGLNENQTSIYKLIFKDNKVEIVYKYLDYEEMKPEYAELVNGKIVVPENSLFFEGQKRDEVYKLNGNELCVFNAETDGFDCYPFIRSKSTHDIEEAINPELPRYFKGQPLKTNKKSFSEIRGLVIAGSKENMKKELGEPDDYLIAYDFFQKYRNFKVEGTYGVQSILNTSVIIYNNIEINNKPIAIIYHRNDGITSVKYLSEVNDIYDLRP